MSKFPHRTTEENWVKIKESDVLWGIPSHNCSYRCAYLSPLDWGESYGNALLEVEFEPEREDFGRIHNFGFDPPPGQICVQFCVFVPIPICQTSNKMPYDGKETFISFAQSNVGGSGIHNFVHIVFV